MRKIHRIVALFAFLAALYVAVTGLTVQLMDMRALLTHAPASDPTVQGIHAGLDGPPNYQVIRDPDYSAAPLPADFNFDNSLAVVVHSARSELNGAPLAFVEFRMVQDVPVGMVASQGKLYTFDSANGHLEGSPTLVIQQPLSRPSLRNDIKDFHRMKALGNWGIVLDMFAGLILLTMVLTGLTLYVQMLRARRRAQRPAPFWFAGGWWRTVHRSVATAFGVFIVVMAATGTILSISSLGVVVAVAKQHSRPAITKDLSSPLVDDELPAMLHTTLAAYRQSDPGVPVKVLRLRYFAGMPQGVVISGGDDSRQIVYNAVTGRETSESEPGYPAPGQTFGWQVDETVKRIHRGDYFGLTGRWLDLFSGIALLYLTVSGGVMYASMWTRRRKNGRRALIWR